MRMVYNNEAIGVISIAAVLKKVRQVSYAKALLILPIALHKELINFLKREQTTIKSIEQLVARRGNHLANFNERFIELIPVSINSIMLLNEMGIVKLGNGSIYYNEKIEFNFEDESLGKRTSDILKATNNISNLLKQDVSDLYLHLRVQI
ncbi:three component ABC system middle component [Aneurinibacillus thermoaerophilus]|uniref:Uncharacterized protein n=1 Tax=Aneurinibacillus thermoaerophilus TaxID=143495 RepID=A0ABX8Y7K0_ANETH|nr:three component ABC system middle component [Aneurinibacillus thermoaerophilus]QYY41511.1 hypothetical protein K3F53_11235 [Aneurinibacillus thermoaerophilus]